MSTKSELMKILNTLPWLLSRTDRNVNRLCWKSLWRRVISTSLFLWVIIAQLTITGQVWASPTLVHSMSTFVCMVCTLDHMSWLVRLAQPVQTVTRIADYCHHSCVVSLLDICAWWRARMGRENRCTSWATPTDGVGKDSCWDQDERATALHHLCVATSPMLTPQCSTFT